MQTKIEFLRELYKRDRGDPSYAKMDTERKQFNSFNKALVIKDWTPAATDIFRMIFVDKKLTLNGYITQLKRDKATFHEQLLYFAQKQVIFYKQELYDLAWENIKRRSYSISDLQIELDQHSRHHKIPLWKCNNCSPYTNEQCIHEEEYFKLCDSIEQIDPFIKALSQHVQQFNHYVDKTLKLLFQSDSHIPLNSFEEVITEAIEQYQRVKQNFSKQPKQTDNTYAIMYMYCRNHYICQYYLSKFPQFISFDGLQFQCIVSNRKNKYSLKAIAELYAKLKGNSNIDEYYESMKKQFKQSMLLQRYKQKNGRYLFPNIELPLIHYHYYLPKNRSPKIDTTLIGDGIIIENNLLENRLVPIFHLYINGEKQKLDILKKYLKFIEDELNDLFSTLSHNYQTQVFEFLTETIINSWGRLIGINYETVYFQYPKS
ncbi:hypothetical protein [Lysinibacillus sp. BW-2-10]|uniref:hypothetical protein n=1 Tax=Lysinibacillus sp. BW-2-10 TaxID=2590030 RepID=UPI00117F6941|nr:hypothetical protein [Lysinibacillus sp. BW-2-10]TSI04649.1 hypothetical protein FJQ64_13910 [Lysinibacillus sp. BW-2-10]